MSKILAALLCCWCSHALAQSTEELINNSKNSENVTTFGMGYHRNQYSPLTQINKSNVKRLVPVWATSLSNDTGELAQPTIYNGVMYVVNGNWTFALDGWDPESGKKLWRRYTVPAPGEPGSETWPKDMPDAWKYGGGSTWQNGSY